jgi:hypothetical protein
MQQKSDNARLRKIDGEECLRQKQIRLKMATNGKNGKNGKNGRDFSQKNMCLKPENIVVMRRKRTTRMSLKNRKTT